jgi:hypothetical protein
MRRRSVFKGRRVRRRRVSAGITASIANLTESAGTFEATGTESDTSCSSASPVVSSTNSFQRTPVSARGTEVVTLMTHMDAILVDQVGDPMVLYRR